MLFGTKTRLFTITTVLTFSVLLPAQADSTQEEAQRDLTNYANIVVGYDLDDRCIVLNSRQRADYRSHMGVIRHGLEQKGLSSNLLNRLEVNARAAGRLQFSTCDRSVAELIEQLGALTASLGEQMARFIVKKRRANQNK